MTTIVASSQSDDPWLAMAAIAQAVIACTVLGGALGLRQSRKLRILNYEDRFEERYWLLMERLSLNALRGDVEMHEPCDDSDQKLVRSYFRLCETQLNMRAEGWITDNTWTAWTKGMQTRLDQWPFSEIWSQIRDNPRAGRLYTRLRAFTAPNPRLDPCEKRYLSKWFRGLTGSNRR
ncbi:hypothetical protein ABZV29_18440 [Streptomyces sp. NPDC005236]|uniref:hypothetical protein n=1 Tax=Streptomyces sp. NPDC005236 TaxID=3157028 RepID=UPI0033ABD4BB